MNVIRKLSREGDTILAEWSPTDVTSTKAAEKTFLDLQGQGYAMFVATDTSTTPEQVRGFVATAPEILALPHYVGG